MKYAIIVIAALVLQACSVNVIVAPHATLDIGYAKAVQDERR